MASEELSKTYKGISETCSKYNQTEGGKNNLGNIIKYVF